MRRPHISSKGQIAPLDRLASRWAIRYGLAISMAAIPCGVALAAGPSIPARFYLLMLFSSMLVASVVAGMGPGLLATVLGLLIGHTIPPQRLSGADLRLLSVQGVLVSVVGGTLYSARRQARDRLVANLKLEQQILEIGDDERRRLGHDLHDGLGQHLTGISLLSESMAQQMQAGRMPDPQSVETITQLVSEAVGISRDIAKSLSPVTLERDGLVAALEELADTSSALLGIKCECDIEAPLTSLERTRSLHLYRIVQEAVNNSVRHGKARNVSIRLACEGGKLVVTVTDDGSGLSQKTSLNPGLGLRIMQYRARMLGALLTAQRATPDGGTVVTCSCPLNDGAAPSAG